MDFVGAYAPAHLKFLLEGFVVTLEVAFLSIFFSFLIGIVIGVLRYSRIPFLSPVLAVGVETIRNLPMLEQKARQLLLVLGIAGETGTADLLAIIRWLFEQEQQGRSIHDLPPLKELYAQTLQRVYKEEPLVQKEIRAMEQRIRRMVLQAFTHLSSLGLADYTNPTFEHFAPRLFDFEEIRLRMQELEAGEKATKCRINVKKFLTAFYMEIKNG